MSGPAVGGMRPDGWRKATPGAAQTQRLAEAGRAAAVPKAQALAAVKRVAVPLGLKAGDVLLLDTLAAFSQPQDWEAGRQPIVWPSNALLEAQTGFSLSTLKRHARRLAEAGVITFRDSPNGKRWGHRNAEGTIVEAYGFDLSPLIAKAEDFEALAEELAAERSLCQHLKREITILRRTIRAHLSLAGQGRGLADLWAEFEGLLSHLPGVKAAPTTLQKVAEAFKALLVKVEKVQQKSEDLTPREARSDPHLQTTNQLEHKNCSQPEEHHETHEKHGIETKVDLYSLLRACPEFEEWAKNLQGGIRDWAGFERAAAALRPMIGISDHTWERTIADMGRARAAIAFALVFEKVDAGEIQSPNGYLRGMAYKARMGALHLQRSVWGRLHAGATGRKPMVRAA